MPLITLSLGLPSPVERDGALRPLSLPRPSLIPMPRILRIALPIAACAALIAGCENGVPPNGVPKAGDPVTTKAQFNHWLSAAAHGSAARGSNIVLPDPPNFTKCVANQSKQPV